MNLKEKLLLVSPIFLFILILLITKFLPYLFKEKFESEKKDNSVKDFDKNVIELQKVKYDEPKIKDFKPTKTSELKLFCKQNLDSSNPSCYQQ